jgi:hypothetical protein
MINFTIQDDSEVAYYVIQDTQVPANNKTVYIETGTAMVDFSLELDTDNPIGVLAPFVVVGSDSAGNIARVMVECELEQRFTDLSNGTVRDNNTEMIWLENANCFVWDGEMYRDDAIGIVAELEDGKCDLRDGSAPGDWRLPTIEEWEAFVDKNFNNPALCNASGTGQWSEGDAFENVQVQDCYLSGEVWTMCTSNGNTAESNLGLMWPVRSW